MKVTCDYCTFPAQLVSGTRIYPHRPDLYDMKFWLCAPCSAYVGTHKFSPKHLPIGRLANPELRQWKKSAHAAFDPLWKSGLMKRKQAYACLAEQMGIPVKDCHIGLFDVEQCKLVIQILSQMKGT